MSIYIFIYIYTYIYRYEYNICMHIYKHIYMYRNLFVVDGAEGARGLEAAHHQAPLHTARTTLSTKGA